METDPTEMSISGEKHPTPRRAEGPVSPPGQPAPRELRDVPVGRAVGRAPRQRADPARPAEGAGQRERLPLAGGSDRARRHGADLRRRGPPPRPHGDPEGAARGRRAARRDGRDVPAPRHRRGAGAREAAAPVDRHDLRARQGDGRLAVLRARAGRRHLAARPARRAGRGRAPRAASRARASGSSCCRAWSRSPRRSRTRTSAASCTATARRTTSCSASAARRR